MHVTSLSVALGVLSLAQCSAAAPRASWLIYPAVTDSPIVEVLPGPPTVWRLLSKQGHVLAEMTQPPLPDGMAVNLGQCNVAGTLRDDLIAFVRHAPGVQWSTTVSSAWIADPSKKSFNPIRVGGVWCRNEGYGL